jgi:mRNA interferase MazF
LVVRPFVPDAGDLVWLQFDPQAGREQAGLRPALVLSPSGYNGKTNLAVVCPITSKAKGYPFEIELPASLSISGVILVDQMKSLDWKVRHARFAAKLPLPVLEDVLDRLAPLLGY